MSYVDRIGDAETNAIPVSGESFYKFCVDIHKKSHYVYDGKINYSTEKLVILTLISIPDSAHYGKPTSV